MPLLPHGPLNRWSPWLPATGLLLLCAGAALWQFDAALDQRVFDALKLGPQDPLAFVATILSGIGGIAFMGPLALAAAAWLWWRGYASEALWLFLTIAGGRLMIDLLKHAFEKPRPLLEDRLTVVTSWSFPSSHSAGTMMTCLALALLSSARGRSWVGPAIVLAGAVGWSRTALGVHWPSDVIAGLGFDMLWVGGATCWLTATRPVNEPERP